MSGVDAVGPAQTGENGTIRGYFQGSQLVRPWAVDSSLDDAEEDASQAAVDIDAFFTNIFAFRQGRNGTGHVLIPNGVGPLAILNGVGPLAGGDLTAEWCSFCHAWELCWNINGARSVCLDSSHSVASEVDVHEALKLYGCGLATNSSERRLRVDPSFIC